MFGFTARSSQDQPEAAREQPGSSHGGQGSAREQPGRPGSRNGGQRGQRAARSSQGAARKQPGRPGSSHGTMRSIVSRIIPRSIFRSALCRGFDFPWHSCVFSSGPSRVICCLCQRSFPCWLFEDLGGQIIDFSLPAHGRFGRELSQIESLKGNGCTRR